LTTTATSKNQVASDALSIIKGCLNLDSPSSFFLYAGAGSGKTKTLIDALQFVREIHGRRMALHGQHVAVITYTNAACNEISKRLGYDPLVTVKTIHSFAWEELIKGFNVDIRSWLKGNLTNEIAELEEKLSKGRAGTKIAIERERSLAAKNRRLLSLSSIKKFTYNPNGDNRERDSLNHSEVIKASSYFLETKELLRHILVRKFPFLLIDESQDTSKVLMEALLIVQAKANSIFALGLIGDTMQRIYADGKVDLGKNLPADWKTPNLGINYRCPQRVVRLINQVRSEVDSHSQVAPKEAIEGYVRLFICNANNGNRKGIEDNAMQQMAKGTNDPGWMDPSRVKTLTLEHHMAAVRMGFDRMFEPLYKVDKFRTGLLDGTLSIVSFFSKLALPLANAIEKGDRFAVASIIRRESPLLSLDVIKAAGESQIVQLRKAQVAVDDMASLWESESEPLFLDILSHLYKTELLNPPDALIPFVDELNEQEDKDKDASPQTDSGDQDLTFDAIREFLNTPFSQVSAYSAYIKDEAAFGTHQGVKGLEFPRVLVVADDTGARGFLFSYEKLFGAKAMTPTDLKNEEEGRETGQDRTRRLFYVTCSRAQSSLAVVAYSSDPQKVMQNAVNQGWFTENEVVLL